MAAFDIDRIAGHSRRFVINGETPSGVTSSLVGAIYHLAKHWRLSSSH